MVDASARSHALRQLLESVDEDDVDQSFLHSVLASAGARHPELADVLTAAALPHSVTAELVGVLRGRPDDVDGNQRLLDMIGSYRFVSRRSDGGLAFHDNVRDAVLADWRSTEDKRARFAELSTALADHHHARYVEVLRLDRDLGRVLKVMAKANPQRLARLRHEVELAMTASLTEALYHHLLADVAEGFAFFRSSFEELERADRLGLCGTLISVARDFLLRLPADEQAPDLLAWLDYFEGRVGLRLPPYDLDRAAAVFRRLSQDPDLPEQLVVWALDELANAYRARLDVGGAVATGRELVESRQGVDPWNDPVRVSNLAHVHVLAGDREQAAELYRSSIARSEGDEQTRDDIAVLSRLDLAVLLTGAGDWSVAFQLALEALELARLSGEGRLLQYAASRFARLLVPWDAAASDLAAAEAVGYLDPKSEGWAYEVLEQVFDLAGASRLRLARARLHDLLETLDDADQHAATTLAVEAARATLLQSEGREAEALVVYQALADRAKDLASAREQHLDACMNIAWLRTQLGDCAAAVPEFLAAQEEYTASGCLLVARSLSIDLSKAHIGLNDLTAARRCLDDADEALPDGVLQQRAVLWLRRGELAQAGARWDEAASAYQSAYEQYTALRNLPLQLTVLAKLADIASEQSRYGAAAEHHRRAAAVAAELAHLDEVGSSDAEHRVAALFVAATRGLVGDDESSTSLDRGRQLLLIAIESAPDNLWLWLTLASVAESQQDDAEAVAALLQVLRLAPPPMASSVWLHRKVRSLALQQAVEDRRGGDLDRAVSLTADVLRALDACPGGTSAAELAEVRAHHAGLLMLTGSDAARPAYEAALLAHDGSAGDLADAVVRGLLAVVDTVDEHWRVDEGLQSVQDERSTDPALRAATAGVRARLLDGLAAVIGFGAGEPPDVRPLVLQVGLGAELTPLVDPAQDGGTFIYELVPQMRERIASAAGVPVHGVRFQGDDDLSPREFQVRVRGVLVHAGIVDPALHHVVQPFLPGSPVRVPDVDVTDRHPRDGRAGQWTVQPLPAGHDGDHPEVLAPRDYLVHRLERVLRAHVADLLDVQTTSELVEQWRTSEPALVDAVLPDETALLHLTWLLQELLRDGLPVDDPRSLLAELQQTGLPGPEPDLVLRRLRQQWVRRCGAALRRRTRVDLPPQLEPSTGPTRPSEEPVGRRWALTFSAWLEAEVAQHGPWLLVVAESETGRRLASGAARRRASPVVVLTRAETATFDVPDRASAAPVARTSAT